MNTLAMLHRAAAAEFGIARLAPPELNMAHVHRRIETVAHPKPCRWAVATENIIVNEPAARSETALGLSPTTSSEAVAAVLHYYRGELSRMISWRDRLDRTTNWAIGAAAVMLSVSLSSSDSHHAALLFAMLIVYMLLVIEARRYRFFHVYRCRIRLLERHYFAQIFAPLPNEPTPWLNKVGEDLRVPKFTLTLNQAMSRRLRRNYGWIFSILLLAWLLKATSHIAQPGVARLIHSPSELVHNVAIAGVPGELVIAVVVTLYAWLIFLMLRYPIVDSELGSGGVHV